VPTIRPNRPDVIDEVFEGEAVLINLRLGRYYALDASATELWRMIVEGAAAASLVERHPGAPTFLARLVEEDLVTCDGDLPAAAGVNGHTVPGLEVFTDLEELLLLDPIHDVDPQTGWPQAPAHGTS
jgi:hypothetical protein